MNSSSPLCFHLSAVHSNQRWGPLQLSPFGNKLNRTDRLYLPRVLHYASLWFCFCSDKTALTCSWILRAVFSAAPAHRAAVQGDDCNDKTITILFRHPGVCSSSGTYQQHSAASVDPKGCTREGACLCSEALRTIPASSSFQAAHPLPLKEVMPHSPPPLCPPPPQSPQGPQKNVAWGHQCHLVCAYKFGKSLEMLP